MAPAQCLVPLAVLPTLASWLTFWTRAQEVTGGDAVAAQNGVASAGGLRHI